MQNNRVMELLDKLRKTLDDQVQYGCSEHAMMRMLRQVDEIQALMGDERRKVSFRPGTPEFDNYVFQKVNSRKDINRIASVYNISVKEVMQAYNRGMPSGEQSWTSKQSV